MVDTYKCKVYGQDNNVWRYCSAASCCQSYRHYNTRLLHGTELYPKSKDELAENILSAYEENGHKPGSETIKGKTFDDMGDAVLYIQDMLQIEVKDVTKQYLSDIDDNIADIKELEEELEEKKNKALSYISKFVDAV